jgi:malate permease and related proteins
MVELLSIFVNILTPVFLLVGIGYFVGPRLELETRTLSRFSYYILTPAFFFNTLSTAVIPLTLAVRMALFILTVAIVGVVIAWLIAWGLRYPPRIIAAHVLVAAFGNVGNFGIPIIQFKLGEAALGAASFYFLILSTFGFLCGVIAATWQQRVGLSGVVGSLLGFAFNLIEVPLPLFAQRAASLLGGAMIPTMLITLGVQLAGMGRPKFSRDVWIASLGRLLIGPALAMLLVVPLGLTGVERGAGILQASMPTAVLALLIALEYDLLPEFVTTAVLISTVASALTLTVVLALV